MCPLWLWVQDWEEGDGNYVAPELLSDQNELTPAADIYSLGATLYECATGKGFPASYPHLCMAHVMSLSTSSMILHMLPTACLMCHTVTPCCCWRSSNSTLRILVPLSKRQLSSNAVKERMQHMHSASLPY